MPAPARPVRCAPLLFALVALSAAAAPAYDPLALPGGAAADRAAAKPLDLDVFDAARDRTVPVRVFVPTADAAGPRPVVLFSHGLGGARTGSAYLGEHWSRRGYVALFLQHPGSDEAVWRDTPVGERMAALRAAASIANLRLRAEDVAAVLDTLATWNGAADHALAGRLDLDRVGMSGHSFGAQTTQAVSGQSFPLVGRRLTDERIKAAVIMSPGSPQGRTDAGGAFAGVTIPWLLMTGTADTSPIGGQSVASRLAVFPALPAGLAYQLVLDGGQHSAFTDRALPGDTAPRDPGHHRSILALSTAFWDAHLRGDAAARAWLDGDGPRSVIAAADRWERK